MSGRRQACGGLALLLWAAVAAGACRPYPDVVCRACVGACPGDLVCTRGVCAPPDRPELCGLLASGADAGPSDTPVDPFDDCVAPLPPPPEPRRCDAPTVEWRLRVGDDTLFPGQIYAAHSPPPPIGSRDHSLWVTGEVGTWRQDLVTGAVVDLTGSSGHPGHREAGACGNIEGARKTVLWRFGGETSDGSSDELWRFDRESEAWEMVPRTTTWPSPRKSPLMAREPAGEGLILYGGVGANGETLGDLWQYRPLHGFRLLDGGDTLPARRGSALAGGLGGGELVDVFLYGGGEGEAQDDLWHFVEGSGWGLVSERGAPGPRVGAQALKMPLGASGQQVFVFGGEVSGPDPRLWYFDPWEEVWGVLAASGTQALEPEAVVAYGVAGSFRDNEMYFVGGSQPTWAYARESDQSGDYAWASLGVPDLPPPRTGAAVAYVTSALEAPRLVVHGGANELGETIDDLWFLRSDQLAWSSPNTAGSLPTQRSDHALLPWRTREGPRVLLLGGLSLAATGEHAADLIYTIGDGNWVPLGPSLDTGYKDRNRHFAATRDHCQQAFLHGGTQTGDRPPKTFLLDPATSGVRQVSFEYPGAPNGGHLGAAAVYARSEAKYHVLGGVVDDTPSTSLLHWVYDPANDVWGVGTSTTAQGPQPLQPPHLADLGAVYLAESDRIVVFGGLDGVDAPQDELWSYSLARREWTRHAPDRSPGPRAGHGLVATEDGVGALLFGGESPSGLHRDVWELTVRCP